MPEADSSIEKVPTGPESTRGPTRRRGSWQMALPFPLLLALRYLRSARKDAHVSFLSLLAGGGIGLGVAALVIVLSGLAGLQHFLRSDVLARTPHLEIELPEGSDAEAARRAVAEVEGVESVRLLLRGRGWMLVGGRPVDVRVVGFSGSLPALFPQTEAQREESLERGVFGDETLALRWDLQVGDRLELVSTRPTLTPFGPQPRLVSQRFAGTFQAGRTEIDEHRIAVPLEVARRLFGDRLTRLEVRAAGLEQALELAAVLAADSGPGVGPGHGSGGAGPLPVGSRIRTWEDLNRGLFFALQLEKRLMFLAVFLIVPVAAMALVTVLALLVSAKRSEIGMLHALGATPREVSRAFLVLGSLLSIAGLLVGGALGMAGAWALDHYALIAPPGDVYFIDHVPFRLEAGDLGSVALATLVFTFGSTAYAARRAAALDPLEALRAV
ncbi:MAG: FtsX-like permease family protein [Holophagales bacterium]|nr:FtsX-like permease family protein [Holophagales bacterium]